MLAKEGGLHAIGSGITSGHVLERERVIDMAKKVWCWWNMG